MSASNPHVSFTLGEQNTDNELWDGILHWKAIKQNESANFLYYKIVVKQIQNEASGIDGWDKTTETIIATTVDNATADALNTDQLFRDFYDTATELPYTEYKYKITARAYYQNPTDASATVHSEAVRNYFGIINAAVTKRPAFSE